MISLVSLSKSVLAEGGATTRSKDPENEVEARSSARSLSRTNDENLDGRRNVAANALCIKLARVQRK